MIVFTVLGLAIFIFLVLIGISILFSIAIKDEECHIGFICVLVFLSVIIALFITEPQEFGYEKITVSENSIEKEGE